MLQYLVSGLAGNGLVVVLGFSAASIAVISYLVVNRENNKNYPSGPRRLPIFGNLIAIGRAKDVPTYLDEMRRIYGDCFRLQFGKVPVIVIMGYTNLKKILTDDGGCCTRPPLGSPEGLIYANTGDHWAEKTRVIVEAQKEAGVMQTIQNTIEADLEDAREGINKGQAFDPVDMCKTLSFDIIIALIMGERLDTSKEEDRIIKEKFDFATYCANPDTRVERWLPFLNCLPSTKRRIRKGNATSKELCFYLKQKLAEHVSTFDPDNIRDIFDMFIKLSKNLTIDEDQLFLPCLDLISGGQDSVVSAFLHLLFVLVKYPDVQERCRKEISEIVPSDRNPSFRDMSKMKFVYCTIRETLRLGRTVATDIPRSTGDNSLKVGEYTIPPNHVVIFDIREPQIDPTVWDEPDKFDPMRWMDKDGSSPGYIALGTGPRQCPGKDASYLSLYLLLTLLVRRYKLEAEDRGSLKLDHFYTGLSQRPCKSFKIKLTEISQAE